MIVKENPARKKKINTTEIQHIDDVLTWNRFWLSGHLLTERNIMDEEVYELC